MQLFSALGGIASFFGWLGIKPEGWHMSPTGPHIFWLILGLVLFAVSILSSARAQVQLHRAPPPSKDEVEVLRKCEEERIGALSRVKELESQLEVFSPLQIEACRLAREMQEFLSKFEPAPTAKGILSEQESVGQMVAYTEWRSRLDAAYSLRFASQVKTLHLKFGEIGISADRGNDIFQEPEALVAMAHEIDRRNVKTSE